MTKLKNTKKGMAKKALSISLVAAMLATSNVPVWAAEFTDGTDAVVEAPVVEEAVDTFSAEAEAPVVEEEVNDSATLSSGEYTAKFTDYLIDDKATEGNAAEWGGTLSTTVDITENSTISGATLKAVWQVNGKNYGNTVELSKAKKFSCLLDASLAGAKINLFVYAEKAGEVVWSAKSDAFTVKTKDISKIVKATVVNPTYNGKEQKPAPGVNGIALHWVDENNRPNDGVGDPSNYDITYTGEVVNAGGKATAILTPKADVLKGYHGQLTATYEIQPMELNSPAAIAAHMTATFKNTTYAYTGNRDTKIKKSDITLVDKETGEDLSGYLRADKDGYVDITLKGTEAGQSVGADVGIILSGTPETGNKNYKITSTAGAYLPSENDMTIVARDLSTVNVAIAPQKYTGEKVEVTSSEVTLTDKTTSEKIVVDALDVKVPDNAIERGDGYVAEIKPGKVSGVTTKNFSGSTTGTFSIYSQGLETAYFEKYYTGLPAKEYTGDAVTFTTEELGSLMNYQDGEWKKVPESDYEIAYSKNTNAGTAKLIVKGKNGYLGSKKEFTFTINAAAVSSVKAAEHVELQNVSSAKEYKDAMAVAVKAKNGKGKEFTLTEGVDYTVKYDYEDANNNSKKTNEVGDKVVAKITITNPNFKGHPAVTLEAESKIAAAILKSEYIKLKGNSFTYTGQPVKPEFDVVIGGKVINPDYYTPSYINNTNAGTATLSITGDGVHYSGTAKVDYTIKSADASKLVGVIGTKQYTGYSLEVAPDEIDLTLDGNKIDVASNFNLTFGENLNIGEGTVTLTPKNDNFTGTKELKFQICGELLNVGGSFKYWDKNGFEVTSKKDSLFKYDGTAHTFAKTEFTYAGTEKLVEGKDYELKYVDNVYGKAHNNVQKGAVLAVAIGKYGSNVNKDGLVNGVYTDAEGNKTANVIAVDYFKIDKETIAESNISVSNGTYAAGLLVKPQVSIVVKGVKLVEGKDYELELTGNKDMVNATTEKSLTVTIKGKNGYEVATTVKPFKWGIDKFDLANADVKVDDGKISVKCGAVDVDASEYTTENNGDGTTTIKAVKDSRNYTGSKVVRTSGQTEAEKPEAPMITDVTVKGNNATVILSGESGGATGYDYVISKDRNCINNKKYAKVNKNILTTKTTFTYTGQGTYYAYCHAWKKVDGKKVFSDWSNPYLFVVDSVTPEQPAITSVKVSKNTVKVTYTKSANATGYDLVLGTEMKKVNGEMRPVKYGKLVKKVYNGNTVTATFTKVGKGTYYAGLHAYNRTSEDGKKVFSPWSNAKKVGKRKILLRCP